MTRPLRIHYPGAYYHVTCRGNERRSIFADEKDLSLFLEKLALSLEIYSVILLAYVCMRNHFHLIVKTPRGNLSECMRHFNISYTTAYNHRHHRSGHLYQGRYKAFLIDADNHLLAVSRYIHLDPARTRVAEGKSAEEKWRILMKYRWSSLQGYLSPGKRVRFPSCSEIVNYTGGDNVKGREGYRRYVQIGLGKGLENPLELGKGHGVVGENEFIKWVKSQDLKDVVQIALNTGMRRSEILQLKWEQVNIEQGYITVIKTKSGKQRIVPMNRTAGQTARTTARNVTARNVLINRPKNGIFIFCGMGNPNGAVWSGFDLAVKRAGLGRCRFHDLRHTFATKLVLSGVSLPVVKELLGHESITTTMRYAHPTPDSKRQAVEMQESQTAVSDRHDMDTSLIEAEKRLSVTRCD